MISYLFEGEHNTRGEKSARISDKSVPSHLQASFKPGATTGTAKGHQSTYSQLLQSCKQGEKVQELVARIRQEVVTCYFMSVKDQLDEALCTRLVCSINNEAVLKALLKVKHNELTLKQSN